MTLEEGLLLFLVAGVCGSIAQAMVGYSHGGCLVSIALGFIGALLGAWLARTTALPDPFPIHIGNRSFPVVWSIVGAALFVAFLKLVTRRADPYV
jgi:uncharacterized membrane protein YeaQ/YmgE (transglycosylase-associated protein family)